MWNALRPWIFPVTCLGCGRGGAALCAACSPGARERRTFTAGGVRGVALGAYDGLLRDAIVAMKRGERAYLDDFAALLAPLVPRHAVLVPLPTTRARVAARGFDQSVELARRIARLRDGRCAEVLAKRGPPQFGRGRVARMRAGERFALVAPGGAAEVTLLDDVCTTGATLRDAAAALAAASVRVRGAVTLAHTPPDRNQHRAAAVLGRDGQRPRGAFW